jgi:hypothetical protein
MRDIEMIDAELRLVAALRVRLGSGVGPLPSIDVAEALLDERTANNNYNVNCEYPVSAADLSRP